MHKFVLHEKLTSQYWAGDTFGILKHVNKKTYFIYFHKTPQAMLVYSLYFHNRDRSFNLNGRGYGFLFRSDSFFRTSQE
jgi:hypothetical protein